ncbi:MAG: VCBS repeat-containing protein [Flavobacteriales bacterium]|nr:VCBS repeat-containing protein [Flavobacteriales bacterium]
MKSADLDGDGDLDLVMRDAAAIIWSENVNGAGSFAPVDTLFVNDPLHEFDLGDLDGDGDLDLILAIGMPPQVAWAENGALRCHDMNGDTEADVLFTAFGNHVHTYFNDAGSFPVHDSVLHLGGPPSSVLLAGDLDLDGDEDQLSINWNGFVSAGPDLTGTGTSWTVEQIATGWMQFQDLGTGPLLLDVDGDGDFGSGRCWATGCNGFAIVLWRMVHGVLLTMWRLRRRHLPMALGGLGHLAAEVGPAYCGIVGRGVVRSNGQPMPTSWAPSSRNWR